MSNTTASSGHDGHEIPLEAGVPAKSFTLRDLYVRASISGNSLATELSHYLNIDESRFSSRSKEDVETPGLHDEPTVHEQALAAILDVVTSDLNATFEYVRVPEPQGGVQEWWARMLSGSVGTLQSRESSR